jgi:UDP-N-acetyl-D-glucosamine dehydrogenase
MEFSNEIISLTMGTAPSYLGQSGYALQEKIRRRTAHTGVIGLGYVGLPLALEMVHAGFQVTGVDLAKAKVDSINAGLSYVPDVASKVLQQAVFGGKMQATDSLAPTLSPRLKPSAIIFVQDN